MSLRTFASGLFLAVALVLVAGAPAWSQAGEQKTPTEIKQLVARAAHCIFDDLICIEGSKKAGEEVVLTDTEGNVLYDAQGYPCQDPHDLSPECSAANGPGQQPPGGRQPPGGGPVAQPASPCVGAVMMSTIANDFRQWHQDAALAGSNMNPLKDWQQYEQQLIPRGLMPLPSAFAFTGLVTDAGQACADHVGDNFMFETMLGTMTQQDMQKRVEDRMKRMTPEEGMEMMQSMQGMGAVDPMGADVIQQGLGFPAPTLPASVMKDLEGSAMFELYSPNGVSWIMGSVLQPTGDRPIYEHGGLGGWKANTAAQIWIVLPGTKVSSLQAGGVYNAIMPSFGGGVGDPFYVWTVGVWKHRDPMLFECAYVQGRLQPTGPASDSKSKFRDAFEGTIWVLETSGLTGTLTVTDTSGGRVQADFKLTGPATLREENYEYVYSGSGVDPPCEYGGTGRLVRGALSNHTKSSGDITITGSIMAPASVEVSRPARRIGWTRTVN